MFDKNLSNRIKELFEYAGSNGLKLKDIAYELRVKKHKYKDLSDTLNKLVKENTLILKNRRFCKQPERKQLTGIFDARPLAKNNSFAFVITDTEDVYVSAEDIMSAYDGDTVSLEIKYEKRGRKSGIITKIVIRKRNTIIGVAEEYHGKYYLVPDNSRIHTNFEIAEIGEAKQGQKIVLKVLNWGNKQYHRLPVGNVKEILGKAGDPDVEILSVIKHYDLPLEFPKKVLSELESVTDDTQSQAADRTDFRKLLTFTIDPASAKDFDDAVSLIKTEKGWKLYVHIADVAHYVSLKSELYKEAMNRGNSYYFPKKVIPMLPEKISNNICSLRPFEEKLTLTVITEFDSNLDIVAQDVTESIIKSDARFSYEEIDDFFDDKDQEIPNEIQKTLRNMRKLSSSLSSKRVEKGYLSFNLPETQYVFDDDGHVTDLVRSRETESHKLIENFMLIANEYTAGLLSKYKTIYRIHEQPEKRDVTSVTDLAKNCNLRFTKDINVNKTFQNVLASLHTNDEHRVFDRLILRNLKKAKYHTTNFGHFGLAMQNYTHFTSPIRRLSDLLIHHQIKAEVNGRKNLFSPSELKKLAIIATEKEMIADESEREVDSKNKMIFMRKRLGEVFEGIIINMKPSKLIIELDRFPVTGVLPVASISGDRFNFYDKGMKMVGRKTTFNLADKIEVLVSKVDDDIYFRLAD
jgi:ribonuclease R